MTDDPMTMTAAELRAFAIHHWEKVLELPDGDDTWRLCQGMYAAEAIMCAMAASTKTDLLDALRRLLAVDPSVGAVAYINITDPPVWMEDVPLRSLQLFGDRCWLRMAAA